MLTSAFTKSGLTPDGVVINPRAWVEMTTSFATEDVATGIQPTHMSHHRGSHNKADEATVTIDASAFAFPIRQVAGCVFSLYYGLVENPTDSVKSPTTERFFGIVQDYDLDKQGRIVTLKAQDLSCAARKKTYPVRKTLVQNAEGITTSTIDPTPRYSDTLQQACERMLSILPEFGDKTISPLLTFRPTDALKNAKLSSLVHDRASKAPIALHPDCTVWEGIEHLCGLLGLHVRVELREIVIRTSEEVFAGRSSKATFIFGGKTANAYGPKIHKKPVANRNGVRVNAVNPDTRELVTAVYPSEALQKEIAKKQPRHQKPAPKKPTSKKPPKETPPPPRDVYELDPGHYTPAALEAKAKAIWLERSRQEADGTVSVPLWTEEILQLGNGDLVTIKIDYDVAQQVAKLGDDAAASKFLQDTQGYGKDAADALVKASRKPSADDWYAKEIIHEWPSGNLSTVHFINLIEV